jgi:PleD family two-component response regulator
MDYLDNQRKKIVYMDDVNFHLVSVKARLGRHYEVFPAQSAETFFEILENITPDLILLDINMPEYGGLEMFQTLKDIPRFADLPVIFLTGSNDDKTLAKAIGLGATDLVVKPFSDAELIAHIENQLSQEKQEEYMPVILAVDDNPSILKSINGLLHSQYKVYTLPNPEAMKTILEKITPDLFLLDCNMPVMSGFDLIPLIRAFPGHERTPIVFLTSEGDQDTLYAAVSFGASDFIVKPIDETVLRDKLAVQTKGYMIRRLMRKEK